MCCRAVKVSRPVPRPASRHLPGEKNMATRRPRADSPAVTATANVHLWGQLAGQVLEFANGRVGFTYDRHYLATGRALSPKHLPLEAGIFEFPGLRNSEVFLGLPGVLAGSLPGAFGHNIIHSYFKA